MCGHISLGMNLNKPFWPCVDLLLLPWLPSVLGSCMGSTIPLWLYHGALAVEILILLFPLGGSDCFGVETVRESNVRTYSGDSGFGVWETGAQFAALMIH